MNKKLTCYNHIIINQENNARYMTKINWYVFIIYLYTVFLKQCDITSGVSYLSGNKQVFLTSWLQKRFVILFILPNSFNLWDGLIDYFET